MADLEDRIARGDIAPVYLLAGTDPLLYGRVVGALAAALVTPATRAFNHDAFEGRQTTATAILTAARTLPMMARRRLVVVRDADALGADGLAALVGYLEAPSPETCLVLSIAKADGRLKLVQLAKKKGFLHTLEVPRNLAGWIAKEATRAGARVTPDAARRLADVIGADLGRLASSLEQLALYVGDERPIQAEDVDELVAETRERSVFELANAVGQGSRERALRAVTRLLDQRESAIGVTMMLARHVRQIALVKELAAARTPRAELPRLAGVPLFALDGLLAQSRRFTAPALRSAVALLAQADVDLKSPVRAALGERMVLERLVEGLLALAR